ncbi:MAG: DUF2067 domain-containing protein [Thermoprotei archaeon]|nr:MAG: DUF2067 domain-containing protein [Thermoprotei archaeon]
MPLIKRFFYIPCRGEECFKLAELIKEKIPSVEYVDITIEENGLYITMYGYKTDIKYAWEYIRRLISSYKSSITALKGGVKRIKIEYLVEKTRKTFPPIVLVEILERLGYKAGLNQDKTEIYTDAPTELIEEIVNKIWEVINAIKYDVRGTTSKYFAVVLSIVLKMEPEQVLSRAYSMGIMDKDEEGKYRIKKEWRKALNEFISEYRNL